jgi:maltooligosyltrehalose trehalohydrolase
MPDWQLEMGARVLDGGDVRFRVYAPRAHSVELETYPWPGDSIERIRMMRDSQGFWSVVSAAEVGTLYRYRLDGDSSYPDPYSRSQPEGVHGPSQVVSPAFAWTDSRWRGPDPDALVIYELHVGAYTQEGTFDAIIPHLDGLRDLGVTAIELMPVGEFPGQRNWGYDGAHRFAPDSSYGGPARLRRLVDAAHARGIGVILDVVYNHLGPDGDYLHLFVRDVLTDSYETPWGRAINFDDEGGAFVRQYFIDNVLYWMHEFHLDGFRVDATHEFYDKSDRHILRELAQTVHEHAPEGKRCVIMAEHEQHDLRLVRNADFGGFGFDGVWVDDFHHSVFVQISGQHSGYLNAYSGTMDELARLLRVGMLYGDGSGETNAKDFSRHSLIFCLQNHDQIGNRCFGTRLTEIVGLELYKAAYALLLLMDETPLIFMGDEFAASTPFLYFVDHTAELAALTAQGRETAFAAFWAAGAHDSRESPDAQAESSLLASKLDWGERGKAAHDGVLRMFRELLSLRRKGMPLRLAASSRFTAEAVSEDVLVVERMHRDDGQLVAVNFGNTAQLVRQAVWSPILSTAETRFAGPGIDLSSLWIAPGSPIHLPPKSTTVWKGASGPG